MITIAGKDAGPGDTAKTSTDFFSRPSTHYLLLIIVGAVLFIPFLGSAHLYDWDELNFAEASREMLETGNFMRVTINYEPFWEKPPLFFWLQAISMKFFGVNEFAARFVNALTGIVTLCVVYTIGRRRFDAVFGLLWAFAFAGSFLPHLFFKSGIIDPVFNLFIFLGLTFLSSLALEENRARRTRHSLIAGLFIGLATLTKGPVALLVIVLTVAVFWAFSRFKPLLSLREMVLFAGATAFVSALFYGLETALHGPWFMTEFIRYQIRLFRTGDAGHGRPFYFHFIVLLFGCFPASFFALRSFRKNTGYRDSQRVYNRFVTVLFWVVLLLFSIVKTKTVLYASLCWYPITYLAALHMRKLISGEVRWGRGLLLSFIVFTVLVGTAITVFPFVMMHKEFLFPFIRDRFAVACLEKPVSWSGFESLIGAAFLTISGAAFILIARQRIAHGLAALFVASAMCLQLTLIVINPKIEQYTQADPVSFYKLHSGENEYVRALFKSYGDLFYGKKRRDDHPSSYQRSWLLKGPIDKPVFFVARTQQDKKYGSPEFGLTTIEKRHGYVYYRRDPDSLRTDYALAHRFREEPVRRLDRFSPR